MQDKIKIIIATHRQYLMPSDEMYLPVHVGKKDKQSLGYIGDDSGDNISDKNPYFCELTGLYWAWKNLNAEYIGLIHYRRFFSAINFFERRNKAFSEMYLTQTEALSLLQDNDVLVPKKRKYYIETLYSHYAHTMHKEHLDITREIIQELCPTYLEHFDSTMKQISGHMFNMFIMRKDLVDEYCQWLFPILFELEKRIDVSKYSGFHSRLYGRVSELLFNVWLNSKKLKVKELPFVYAEKINWFKKGTAFLMAKFFGKKYETSF